MGRHKPLAVTLCVYTLSAAFRKQLIQPPGQYLICAPSATEAEGHPFLVHFAWFAVGALHLPPAHQPWPDPFSQASFRHRHSKAILFHGRIGFLHPGHQSGRLLPASPPVCPETSRCPRPWRADLTGAHKAPAGWTRSTFSVAPAGEFLAVFPPFAHTSVSATGS